MLCFWAVLLAQSGSFVCGFVMPRPSGLAMLESQASSEPSMLDRHRWHQPLLKSAVDETSTEDKSTNILMEFPSKEDPQNSKTINSNDRDTGYSINGYTGNSSYQNALNNPQPGTIKRNRGVYEMDDINEDGYGDMRAAGYKRSMMAKIVKFPVRAFRRITKRPKNYKVEPGVLILVRHGESVWNANKTFTGG